MSAGKDNKIAELEKRLRKVLGTIHLILPTSLLYLFTSCNALLQVQAGARELQTSLDHKSKDIAQCKAQLEYQCLGRPSWSIRA